MTELLASIASVDEIAPALAGGADVLDLKDPKRGALGAWDAAEIGKAVAALGGLRTVSATIGDLPMEADLVAASAGRVAAQGPAIVKVGMFAGARRECIAALAPLTRDVRLVAVLFADSDPDVGLLPALAESGFYGAMLDTAEKSAGTLRDCMDDATLAEFVSVARALGLATGLAGSLTLADVAPLMALRSDFLGFRRALCAGWHRTGAIDALAVASVKSAMESARPQAAAERNATATAGAQIAAE